MLVNNLFSQWHFKEVLVEIYYDDIIVVIVTQMREGGLFTSGFSSGL